MNSLMTGVNAVLQNVVYALPGRETRVFSDTAATIQLADDADFAAPIAVTLANGSALVPGGAFIRCTSGNINLILS